MAQITTSIKLMLIGASQREKSCKPVSTEPCWKYIFLMYIHFIPKFFQPYLGFILVKSKLGVEANLFKLCTLQSYPQDKTMRAPENPLVYTRKTTLVFL